MPTYEYACRSCGEHLEVVQGFKDAALTECGRCGGDLRKVFSAAGIIFKGSGYYVTDSRKASGTGSKSSDDAGGSGSDSGKDTGTKKDTTPTKDTSPASGSTSSDSSANSA